MILWVNNVTLLFSNSHFSRNEVKYQTKLLFNHWNFLFLWKNHKNFSQTRTLPLFPCCLKIRYFSKIMFLQGRNIFIDWFFLKEGYALSANSIFQFSNSSLFYVFHQFLEHSHSSAIIGVMIYVEMSLFLFKNNQRLIILRV